jgi:heptosyltransferase II
MTSSRVDKLMWALGNHSCWDGITKKTPPDLKYADIVVHMPNHLGDAVMALPLLQILLRYSSKGISVIAKPELSYLFEIIEGVQQVIPCDMDKRHSRRNAFAEIKTKKYDVSVLLLTGEEAAWYHMRASIPCRIGFDYWGRGWLLTQRLSLGAEPTSKAFVREHHAHNYLLLLNVFGIDPEWTEPGLSLPVDQRNEAIAELQHKGLDPTHKIIAFAPGGHHESKLLPKDIYSRAINQLYRETNAIVLLLGSPSELAYVKDILRGVDVPVINLAGATDLPKLCAYLSLCNVMIGPDSGTGHLAAALGAPIVSIFTSGSPVWTRPLGSPNRIIYNYPDCGPCFGTYHCNHGFKCRDVHANDVVAATLEVLSEQPLSFR